MAALRHLTCPACQNLCVVEETVQPIPVGEAVELNARQLALALKQFLARKAIRDPNGRPSYIAFESVGDVETLSDEFVREFFRVFGPIW